VETSVLSLLSAIGIGGFFGTLLAAYMLGRKLADKLQLLRTSLEGVSQNPSNADLTVIFDQLKGIEQDVTTFIGLVKALFKR
jgi:hypothetical protein